MSDALARLGAALSDRYRIERELGAGGMATVYLAEDLKHDRKVAIKVLKPELAAVLGAERFVIEIKTTAALSHPHILPLFDSGIADGFLFYVMPFIEGETIRDKLNRESQFGVDEAVRITREVADALDYAHRHGVIHRDIKPENILLHDGRAMVMDFGIALAVSAAAGGRMTETGMSLGTPHYMSPEQATADKDLSPRSDIYSLASVLYEMLAGEPPHTGGTAQAVIMKIITDVARPVHELRRNVSPNVDAALAKGLEKLPADRFATAAEFAAALGDRSFATAATSAHIAAGSDGARWRRIAAALAGAVVLASVVAAAGWMRSTQRAMVQRFNIALDGIDPTWGTVVISRDGARLAYHNSEGVLLVRGIGDLKAAPLPGATIAWVPAFSPDGREIALATGFPGAIKVLPVDGGAVRTLVADSSYGTGLAWSEDGWIYFLHGSEYGRDLMRVRASGGGAEFVARPDSSRNELFFYYPHSLPGGKKLLLTVYPTTGEPSIGVLERASGTVTIVAPGIMAYYARSGHVVILGADGVVKAARFNASRGTLTSGFTTVDEGLSAGATNFAPLAISDEGTLLSLYSSPGGTVSRVSRDGAEQVVDAGWRGAFGPLALSPDGSRLAISVTRGGRTELWVKTLASGAFTRLSARGTQNYRPAWSHDGRNVVFTSDQEGRISAYQVPADGITPPSRLVPMQATVDEAVYSADGSWIVFRAGSGSRRDIFAMRPGVDSSVRPIAAGPAEEFSPALSPDNRWLAYASDETGRTEIYVRPFPDAGAARHPVSSAGGSEPLWSHSGRELFFRDGAGNLVAVPVAPGATFSAGTPRVLFSARAYVTGPRHHHYAVSPDDQSFYFVKPASSGAAAELTVTLNWFEELKQKVER